MISTTNASHLAAPMFVRALCEDHDIKVVFGGNTPGYARDNHTIYLPEYASFSSDQLATRDDRKEMATAVSDLYLGTGLHEIGHPTETSGDPAYRNGGDLGGFLWNAIEDIRVDSSRQRKLAGAKRIFNQGYSRLIKMGYWGKSDLSTLRGAFTSWVLLQGRCVLADQVAFKELAAASDAALRSIAGDQFVDDAWKIVARVQYAHPGVEGTKDVFGIVEELLAFLKQAQQPQPQPQQPQSGSPQSGDSDDDSEDSASQSDAGSSQQDESADDDSGGSGTEDSGDDSDSGSPPKGDSEEDDSDSSDAQGNSGSNASANSDGDDSDSANSQPANGSSGKASDQGDDGAPSGASNFPGLDPDQIRQLLDMTAQELPEDVGSAFASALDDAVNAALGAGATECVMPSALKATSANVLYAGDRDTRPLAMRMGRLLVAQSQDTRSYDRMGSRMDSSLLSRVPLGEREVFEDEMPAKLVDTAVQIIVDDSGSMASGDRIGIAKAAALRLCIAMSEVKGVNLRATAFPFSMDGRTDNVRELLPFGGQPRRYASNFQSLCAQGYSTPLAQALTDAHYALSRRSEPRKIALVLTDGEPDGGPSQVKPVIERMRKSHIEVIGIGIQTMTYPDLFGRFEIVMNLGDLESAMFKLLQSTMLKRAA